MSGTLNRTASPDPVAELVARRFESLHGRAPDGLFAAPGRVNLIGEHTDYNDGPCLPIALPQVTLVAVGRRSDDRLTVTSRQQPQPFEATLEALGPGQVSGWASYVAGVVWAARREGIRVPGMDLVVHGTVPLGAGLSSSAALACAVALAVCAAAGVDVDDELRHRLVDVCGRAEREVAGAPTGGMDQTVSLFARAGHALLIDCRDRSLRHVPWRPEESNLALLVIDTRASHALADGGYAARREQCERAAAALGVATLRDASERGLSADVIVDPVLRRRARHVLSEIDRVGKTLAVLERGDLPSVGPILDESHQSLTHDFEVSCEELDVAGVAAMAAGALGARMTGGGFGGSAIALVPFDRVADVRAAVAEAFAERGWPAPGFSEAVASAGARAVHCEHGGMVR
jgi:galactokinase